MPIAIMLFIWFDIIYTIFTKNIYKMYKQINNQLKLNNSNKAQSNEIIPKWRLKWPGGGTKLPAHKTRGAAYFNPSDAQE